MPVDSERADAGDAHGRGGTQQPTLDEVTPPRQDRPTARSEAAADHRERHIEGEPDVTLGQFTEWSVDEQMTQPADRGPGRVPGTPPPVGPAPLPVRASSGQNIVLGTACLDALAITLDTTIVDVTPSELSRQLDVSTRDLHWIVGA